MAVLDGFGCIPRVPSPARQAARRPVAALGAWLGWVAAGCLGRTPYPCQDDAQCVLDGQQGVCEAERYCSLPDDACPSRRRFSEHAPADLAERCVVPEQSSTTDSGGTLDSEGDSEGDSDGSISGGIDPACEVEGGCGCAQRLVLAFDRTCVIRQDAQLWCWGANGQGQLGDPQDDQDDAVPRRIPLGSDVVDVALGSHACALTEDGVICWGPNGQGQVDMNGSGSMGQVLGPTPATDPRLHDAFAIGVGHQWSCALYGAGALLCWGDPLMVELDSELDLGMPMRALAMMRSSICVLAEDGTVWCAGDNSGGELGRLPDELSQSLSLIEVPGLNGINGVVSTEQRPCAWTESTVHCWGRNTEGQAGTMIDENVVTPTSSSLPGVLAMALATKTTCALGSDDLHCWGDKLPGLSGAGGPQLDPQSWLPTYLSGAVQGVGLGTGHACVIDDWARVWCWGTNEAGQVGIPDPVGEFVPMPVLISMECPG